MLDKIIKLSTISGAFLIFCGVLKLILYYSHFKIDIIDYLTFQEIITSFLDDINIILIFGSIMLFVSIVFISVESKKHNMKIEDYIENMLLYFYPYRYRYAIFFGLIITILILLNYSNFLDLNYFIVYIIVFCTIQFLSYLIMYKNDENQIDYPNFQVLISVALTILVSVYLLAKYDIQNVTNNKSTVKIKTSNSEINCGDLKGNIYLGKTDNFIFIRNMKIKSTIVIPTAEIKQIEFK